MWSGSRNHPKVKGCLESVVAVVVALSGILGVATLSTFTKDCSGFSSPYRTLQEQQDEIEEVRAKNPIPRVFYGCKIGVTTVDEFLDAMEEYGLRVDYDFENQLPTGHTITRYITDGNIWRSKVMLFSFVDNHLISIFFVANQRSDYEYTRDSLKEIYKVFRTVGDNKSHTLYSDFLTGIIFEPDKRENTIALTDIEMSKRMGRDVRRVIETKNVKGKNYDPLRMAYRKLNDCGYELPSYRQFLSDMQNATKRTKLYNTLEREGVDIGLSLDEFLSYTIEAR